MTTTAPDWTALAGSDFSDIAASGVRSSCVTAATNDARLSDSAKTPRIVTAAPTTAAPNPHHASASAQRTEADMGRFAGSSGTSIRMGNVASVFATSSTRAA